MFKSKTHRILTSVTQKGQITIPKEFRTKTGIQPYKTVEIFVENDIVQVRPARDLIDMAGKLKVDKKLLKKYPLDKVRELMEKNYGKFEKSRL